jgi:hypothetical protein
MDYLLQLYKSIRFNVLREIPAFLRRMAKSFLAIPLASGGEALIF